MKTPARILAFLLFSGSSLIAAVPATINYQGVVADSSGTLLGATGAINRKVIFRIYDASTGGNRLWTEEQTVTIFRGEFSVLLGAGTTATGTASTETRPALDTVFTGAATTRFIEIMVDNGDSSITAGDTPISPRQAITSAAFAFRSQVAESILSGSDLTITPTSGTASNYGLGWYGNGRTWNGVSVDGPVLYGNAGGALGSNATGNRNTALLWNASGQVGIGATGSFPATSKLTLQGDDVTTPASQLVIRGNDLNINERLLVGFDTTNNRATLQSYTAASTTGPLLLNPSGGLIGIGTSAPSARLSVEGSISATGAGGYIFGTGGDIDGGLFSPADGVVTLRTNGAERLRADASGNVSVGGNVGIGTTTPGFPLNLSNAFGDKIALWGNSGNTSGFGIQSNLLQIHTDASAGDVAFGYGSSAAMTETMRIKGNGNVGIGTVSPAQKLDVNGNAYVRGQINLDGSIVMGNGPAIWGINNAGGAEQAFWPRSSNGTYINYGTSGFYIRNNASVNTMVMSDSGIVQIGTGWADARLNVGSITSTVTMIGYLDTNGGQTGDSTTSRAMSIRAEGLVLAGLVGVSSDLRIKTDLHATDSAKDLETLMGIEVTDYHFKDKLANGKGPQKKVIAQQLEKVYPQSVNTTKGVVPDIYQKAKVQDGWVALATDLKVGDRVRLISDKEEGVHEVLEVKAGRFLTQFKPAGDQVFVYGREVSDFRSVDYDAISMLNVSATQELVRKLETVQAENAALRRELAEQEKRAAAQAAADSAQNARLIALEKLLTEKAGGLQTVTLKAEK
jgi:hypothetical protein